MASMRLWSWQLHSPCVDRSGDFEAQQSINGRCSRQDRITRESIDGARVKSTCHQASAARRYCGRTRSALLLRYVAATACVLCMWTALCGAQYTSFLQYQGGFDLLDKWDDGFDLLEPRNNREPPADQGGLCAKGFESCLSLHSSAIGQSYQKLGSRPVPPQDWNRTFSFYNKEFVAAAGATGCAFNGSDTLVFANTQYKNILVFTFAALTNSWTLSRTWPSPCSPRGLALLDLRPSLNALFVCAEEGEVLNMSLADGNYHRISSGIDFSPNSELYTRSEYAPKGTVPSTSMQVDLANTDSTVDAASSYSTLDTCHGKTLTNCERFFFGQRQTGAAHGPQPNNRSTSLYTCCQNAGTVERSCCNWEARTSELLRFPTGMDISPDNLLVATGTAYPIGSVVISELGPAGSELSELVVKPKLELDLRHGLPRTAYSPVFSPDNTGLYFANFGEDRVEKLVKVGGAYVEGASPLFIKEIKKPSSICVSSDSKLMGVGGSEEVGVIGQARCHLREYCVPCQNKLPTNASYWRECGWKCAAGYFVKKEASWSTDARTQILNTSTAERGYCEKCGAGKYSDGVEQVMTCTDCPPGKYSNATAMGSAEGCKDCGAGKYRVQAGASSAELCTNCPSNANSPAGAVALANCTCNAGFYGSDGGTCTACVAGKYKQSTGTAPCTDCWAGTYSTSVGASTCVACPLDSPNSPSGSANVTSCTPPPQASR